MHIVSHQPGVLGCSLSIVGAKGREDQKPAPRTITSWRERGTWWPPVVPWARCSEGRGMITDARNQSWQLKHRERRRQWLYGAASHSAPLDVIIPQCSIRDSASSSRGRAFWVFIGFFLSFFVNRIEALKMCFKLRLMRIYREVTDDSMCYHVSAVWHFSSTFLQMPCWRALSSVVFLTAGQCWNAPRTTTKKKSQFIYFWFLTTLINKVGVGVNNNKLLTLERKQT